MLLARRVESMSYSGPIPHPMLLKEFNDVIPNGADRIMAMAEKQSEHRINIEDKVVNANNRDSFWVLFLLELSQFLLYWEQYS